MASNLNVVAITGNCTKDPETRDAGSTTVTQLRVAVNDRRKVGDEYQDVAGYYDVDCWGAMGENCARFLEKGRPVAVHGRLSWREFESDGKKQQRVSITAQSVQFLGSGQRDDAPAQDAPPVESPKPSIPF